MVQARVRRVRRTGAAVFGKEQVSTRRNPTGGESLHSAASCYAALTPPTA